MRIVLKLENGTEEVRDVSGVTVELEGWALELSPGETALMMEMEVPGRSEAFCAFVTHHKCANRMAVALRPLARDPDESASR